MPLSPQPPPKKFDPMPQLQPFPLLFPQMHDNRMIQINELQHPLSLELHPH